VASAVVGASERADPWVAPRPWTGAPPASYGRRARAGLIDALVTVVPLAAAALLLALEAEPAAALLGLAGLAGALLYAPLTLRRPAARNGQTLGKQAQGIRVVRDDGRPITLAAALLREVVVKSLLFLYAGAFFLLIPWLIDVLWPLWDEQRRALHDTMVSTHVVEVQPRRPRA
jgi:uncharacterized RDD family membrane protein YckC